MFQVYVGCFRISLCVFGCGLVFQVKAGCFRLMFGVSG